MDIENIRRQNINFWADKLGRGILASKLGYSDTIYINQLCAGHGSFGSRTARKIEAALDLKHGWMDQIHESNLAEVDRKIGSVPLISFVSAGLFCESPDNFSPGDAEEWLPCPSNHSPKTYALRVTGDSMTSNVPGERSYPHGTIIFVDPEKVCVVGSRVIARLPNTAEATFKVYSEDMGIPYLIPINPRYPSIPMPEGTAICGVVIGSYMPE
jgi:SOS-response transcriptional repressor LexA